MEQLLAAWEARTARFASISASWQEARTDFRGTAGRLRLLGTTDEVFPKEDTVHVNRCQLWLSGRLSRYEFDGQSLFVTRDAKSYRPRQYATAFDGQECRVIRLSSEERGPHQGRRFTASKHIDLMTGDVRPLLWHFRPLDPDMGGFDPAQLKLSDRIVDVNGRKCLTAAYLDGAKTRIELTVDPEQDFSIVRAQVGSADSNDVTWAVTAEYRKDDRLGWLPSAWQLQARGQERRNTVRSIVVDPELAADHFAPAFPEGTLVSDEIANRRYLRREDGRGEAAPGKPTFPFTPPE